MRSAPATSPAAGADVENDEADAVDSPLRHYLFLREGIPFPRWVPWPPAVILASLRVEMDTSPYSGVFLVYFPRDWRAYRVLVLDVHNPSPEPLDITCRIHDRRHEEGEQRYTDRFNRSYRLPSGWNEIRIDLGEVAKAPADRTMDLGNVRAVGLFAGKLPAPRTMHVDFVRLE